MQIVNASKAILLSFNLILYSFCILLYLFSENLELADDPRMITHPEVGKYFKEFKGTYYFPNDEKLAQYPEDMPMTLQFCRDKYGS